MRLLTQLGVRLVSTKYKKGNKKVKHRCLNCIIYVPPCRHFFLPKQTKCVILRGYRKWNILNYFAPKLSPDELRKMSAIALAHMGDAVYETLVRTWLCVHGTATGKDLHRATIALVCAPAQAEKMQKVLPLLTDEEQAVYKRGRNANVHTMSRSATPAQYHSATGLECLMGYLYLKGDKNRAEELFRAMMEET